MKSYKCPYDFDQSDFRLEWYEENFEKLINERDELYWKTQEDERVINELRDVIDVLKKKAKAYDYFYKELGMEHW